MRARMIGVFGAAAIAAGCVMDAEAKARWFMPETLYAAPGVECKVFFAKMFESVKYSNYAFEAISEKGNFWEDRWCWTPKDEDAGRRVLSAHLLHLHIADRLGIPGNGMIGKESLCGIESHDRKVGGEELFRHLAAFHDEEAEFLAELLLTQRGDLFYGVLGNHVGKNTKKSCPASGTA